MTVKRESRRVRASVASWLLGDDRGIALPMVLMVFIVGVALISAFLVAIVGSSKVTASSKAKVQAQASAEAGIDATRVAIGEGDPCVVPGVVPGPSIEDPVTGLKFNVTIDCPPSSDRVTVRSTGEAPNGLKQTVEAVFGFTEKPPTAGGPGLFYTYGMTTRMNNYVFDAEHSEFKIEDFAGAAGVYANKGDIKCGSGSVFPSDIYSVSGELNIEGSCLVEGNGYTGGTVYMNGGTIQGDVMATGKVASTLGSGSIGGNFLYRSSYNTWGVPATTLVKGLITHEPGLTGAALPAIPEWQDVSFAPINQSTPPKIWEDAGYGLTTVTGTNCKKWSGNSSDVASLTSDLSKKTIFDLRSCPDGFDTNSGDANKNVKVSQDIAIITNLWYLSGTKFSSTDGAEHTVYLITPDSVQNNIPDCPLPAWKVGFQQGNGSRVDPKIAIYLYTPCKALFNGGGSTFRGQVYTGELEFQGGATVAFAPRNVPGYDFGEDIDTPGSGGARGSQLGDLVIQRNISASSVE